MLEANDTRVQTLERCHATRWLRAFEALNLALAKKYTNIARCDRNRL